MWTPPDPENYNETVWKIARQIPTGQVSTYGQIASMIPPPTAIAPPDYKRLSPRWVGKAMNAVPEGEGIPWHRVINSQGKISLPVGTPAAHEQRTRLENEGVTFDAKERVDFELFGWDGPDADWLEENDLFAPTPLRKNRGDARQKPLF